MNLNKNHLLNKSKTFCVMPWVHLHVTPAGISSPCCIAKACSTSDGMGNAKTSTLLELVNSPQMNELRLDMLNDRLNDNCTNCYDHELQGVASWRQNSNQMYQDIDLSKTLNDGSLSEFTMRYYDMRFSNICNFSCRTCGQEFSSQWEQENKRNDVSYAKSFPKNANKQLLTDVLEQIPHMTTAYFAGGEPLITEEHYLVLEEMIRLGKTDIQLNYNSNISNLQFKNKDIIKLWSHFTRRINMSASIDHVKERAEYIRHGTDWGVVENNFKALRQSPFISLSINSVLSAYNYLTFDVFYKYLIDNDMFMKNRISSPYSVYSMSGPEHLTCHILPDTLKAQGDASMKQCIEYIKQQNLGDHYVNHVTTAANWALTKTSTYAYDGSESQERIDSGLATNNINKFKQEIARIDKIRGEDFATIFPELAPLLDIK